MKDDLIRRQEAIDAFDAQIWGTLNFPIAKDIRKAAQETIKKLSSIQQEGCEYWDNESHICALNRPSAQQWIPVSERLPEDDGEKYFVTYYAETIGRTRTGISYCYANREGFWSDIPLGYKVIAWMPLPEPYKEEGDK